MYALIGTCALSDIDPLACLDYVLNHLADDRINRVGELLPWRVADKLHSPARRHPLPDWAGPDHPHASRTRAWTNGSGEPLTP
uniref:transposase domain-containing protein n=1 Tax=Paraburkholderia sediminicola TaxID=458836 RepID=UPI0038B80B7A